MLTPLVFLSLSDFKSIEAPSAPALMLALDAPTLVLVLVLGVILAIGLRMLLRPGKARRKGNRPRRRRTLGPGRQQSPRNWIVVDGSNVMHWEGNAPRLAPILQVVEDLKTRGYAPGVVFDANAGWKLFGKYLNERDLGRMLGLPTDQVLVVPKGTQADPYILDTARKFSARIVTNDRYRDWAEAHPEVTEPGFLVRGGMQEGKLTLKGLEPAKPGTKTAQA